MKTKEEILSDYIDLARAEYPNQKWMSNEEILESPENRFMIMAMEEYGKQQYNKAVLDCIENATTETSVFCGKEGTHIDENSMLKLIKK